MNSSKAQTSEQQDKLKELDEKLQELATKSEAILEALNSLTTNKEAQTSTNDEYIPTILEDDSGMEEDEYPTQEQESLSVYHRTDHEDQNEASEQKASPKEKKDLEDDLQM